MREKDRQKEKVSRRRTRDAPDPEWAYAPAPLSPVGEQFLHSWLESHPPTLETGLTVFVYEPVIRRILFYLEQPASQPDADEWSRITSYVTHVASHADRLLFGAGTRAQRERVFVELIEGMALLSFAPGGLPRLPQICDAFDAEVIGAAFTAFKQDPKVAMPQPPPEGVGESGAVLTPSRSGDVDREKADSAGGEGRSDASFETSETRRI